jgi:hypothetical protein
MSRFLTLLVLPFLSLSLVAADASAQTAKPKPATGATQAPVQKKAHMLKEPASKLEFPAWLYVGSGKAQQKHDLVALAIRTKTWFNVKVYAFGFYVHAEAATPLLKPYAKRKWKDLLNDRNFDKAMLSDKFGKTIRLVMARDVDADDMAEAFEDSLKPRVKAFLKKGSDEDRVKGAAAVEKFQAFFDKEAVKNQEIIFTWIPGGRLQTSVDGVRKPEIKNAALTWALFDVYLGDDPISEDGKENILKAFPSKLKDKAKKASGGN